ncbi:vWA domain-containing protein [Rhizobium metallidurans]|uniref:Flp pilus assembly protein TadG n=1 Tax=Rhizobium metallidurans TaxID=1265931 RepID=A0A7W6D1H6_9HYPH|nr:TadE/TadG family type IV pilus assembly protein [Rhizobium metallidurans]MBB3966471.1 Flp pilus assembly protein TadG [Rhizobium metallidurans]
MLYVQDIKRLLGRRDGNFGITTALVLPILVGVAGLAVDTANLSLSQRQLQEATDASALAVSTALANGVADETSGKALGLDFLSGQIAGIAGSTAAAAAKKAATVSITTTTTSSGKSFVVNVVSSMPVTLTPLSALIAGNTMTVAAASKTTSGSGTTKNGISIELVLDASSSMAGDTTTQNGTKCAIYLLGICIGTQPAYYSKIDALKIAAAKLFDSLDKYDPNTRYVRSGAISYTSSIKGQSPMAWGTTNARDHVKNIVIAANNGTDATAAMKTANANIAKNLYGTDTESVEQAKKLNTSSDRIIVLMTDGDMTGDTSSWVSKLDQSVRDECSNAKAAGIKIYTVAFMAPDKGQALLKFCASSDSNYYEPNTMDALTSAFSSIGEAATKSTSRLTN